MILSSYLRSMKTIRKCVFADGIKFSVQWQRIIFLKYLSHLAPGRISNNKRWAICFVFSMYYNEFSKSERLEAHLTTLFQKSSVYTHRSLTRVELSLEVKSGFLKCDFYYTRSQSTVGMYQIITER